MGGGGWAGQGVLRVLTILGHVFTVGCSSEATTGHQAMGAPVPLQMHHPLVVIPVQNTRLHGIALSCHSAPSVVADVYPEWRRWQCGKWQGLGLTPMSVLAAS